MKHAQKATAIFSIFLLLLTACGGGGGNGNTSNINDNTQTVSISITPTLNMYIGETKTLYVTTQNTDFTVSVSPASGSGCAKSGNNAVTCMPTAAGNYTVTATATADTSKKATATVGIEIPEYIGIVNFGEIFDFAILGKDGSGYFYEFQDENPIPRRLSIYDGNNREVKLLINFGENGLPKNILSEDFTVVLGNYEENRFSAVVITKDGESYILDNIETDVNWDEYINDLESFGISAMIVKPQGILSWFNDNIIKPVVKSVNTVASAVACGAGIGLSTTGIGAIAGVPLAAYGCTNLVLNGLELLDGLGVINYESPQFVEVIRTNGGNVFQTCATMVVTGAPWGCIFAVTAAITNELGLVIDSKAPSIELGEGILQTGSGNVQITLIWDNYADIDLHCIDPAGVHIYYGNTYSYYTGGFLDYDNTVAYGPENIYFSPASNGTYRVYIHYYSASYGISSVRYQVAVNINGRGYVYEGIISGQGSTVDIVTFTL